MFHIRTLPTVIKNLLSCISDTYIPALLLVSIGITLKHKKMKPSTNTLSSIKSVFAKIFFSMQVVVLSTGIPVLYCVGVTHNVKDSSKEIIIKTNKGKTIVEPYRLN